MTIPSAIAQLFPIKVIEQPFRSPGLSALPTEGLKLGLRSSYIPQIDFDDLTEFIEKALNEMKSRKTKTQRNTHPLKKNE